MDIVLNYKVKAGKYDNNDDVFQWVVKTPNEQLKKTYYKAVMTGTDFDEIPELQALCEEAYKEIAEFELHKMVDSGEDYFALECLGEVKMDLDELNELVHSKNPHAISFFGLEGLTDSDVQKWDSAEIDRIPLIKEFKEGFTPKNPFECGYRLTVWLPECEDTPDDEEIEAYLRETLAAKDISLAEEVILEQNENYSGNLIEKSFEIAAEVGCQEFIDKNK